MVISSTLGSPPLVRERLYTLLKGYTGDGITPARAGKTFQVGHLYTADEDHPRSCGKDFIPAISGCVFGGSPPLVRERLQRRR